MMGGLSTGKAKSTDKAGSLLSLSSQPMPVSQEANDQAVQWYLTEAMLASRDGSCSGMRNVNGSAFI